MWLAIIHTNDCYTYIFISPPAYLGLGEPCYLDTAHVMKNKKPLYFGSVQIRKRYVSFHLMPVYVFPDLLEPVSPDLMKRMQGKSCFNFTAISDSHLAELERLTAAGFTRYQSEKLLGTP